MKNITDFTALSKEEYKVLRVAMENALQNVATSFGITIKTGKATHAPGFCDMKFTLTVNNGALNSREALTFTELAKLYGFKKEDLGREFPYNGKTMKVVGLNQRLKNSIICEDTEGKRYGMPHKLVQDLLKVGLITA